jgi:acyl-CoA dehydrogenase
MAITDFDVPVYQGASMFLVPTDTPGVNILRNTGLAFDAEGHGNHAYVRYEDVRVSHANLLGGEGKAFHLAQTRLGGGRLHHAMRTVGAVARCLDMMCERALSRVTQGEPLAKKQMVQDMIAETWIELHQFRLQVLHAAWVVDQVGGSAARNEIAAVKVATAKVYKAAALRAIQIHGSLGVSNEMPLAGMLMAALSMGLADGPTEVHKLTVARGALKQHRAVEGPWPSEHLPDRRAAARARFADLIPAEH